MTDKPDAAKMAEIVLARHSQGDATMCVLANGAIRIEVGGLCITKSIAAWHAIAAPPAATPAPTQPEFDAAINDWCAAMGTPAPAVSAAPTRIYPDNKLPCLHWCDNSLLCYRRDLAVRPFIDWPPPIGKHPAVSAPDDVTALTRYGNADTDEIGRRSGWGQRDDGYWTPWHIAAAMLRRLSAPTGEDALELDPIPELLQQLADAVADDQRCGGFMDNIGNELMRQSKIRIEQLSAQYANAAANYSAVVKRSQQAEALAQQRGERIAELTRVIEWALGEGDSFPDWPATVTIKGNPKYWWRTELRRRFDAALAPAAQDAK